MLCEGISTYCLNTKRNVLGNTIFLSSTTVQLITRNKSQMKVHSYQLQKHSIKPQGTNKLISFKRSYNMREVFSSLECESNITVIIVKFILKESSCNSSIARDVIYLVSQFVPPLYYRPFIGCPTNDANQMNDRLEEPECGL